MAIKLQINHSSSKHIVKDVEGFEFGESGDVETVVVGQL